MQCTELPWVLLGCAQDVFQVNLAQYICRRYVVFVQGCSTSCPKSELLSGCVQGCVQDVTIFNSMIAACAHGGEYVKARLMFERMAEHGCAPDAVTFANMIRAYKKGGQVRQRAAQQQHGPPSVLCSSGW